MIRVEFPTPSHSAPRFKTGNFLSVRDGVDVRWEGRVYFWLTVTWRALDELYMKGLLPEPPPWDLPIPVTRCRNSGPELLQFLLLPGDPLLGS